jgi:hypothetical protein
MKQCEESLNISITYQNSLGASAENQNELLKSDIERLIQNAPKEQEVGSSS